MGLANNGLVIAGLSLIVGGVNLLILERDPIGLIVAEIANLTPTTIYHPDQLPSGKRQREDQCARWQYLIVVVVINL